MDRNLVRKLAKTAYKKMMKGTPKHKRMTFGQAWPMIKASLEEQQKEQGLSPEVLAAVDSMIDAPVEASPDDVVEAEVVSTVEHEHIHDEHCDHNH